MAHVRPLVLDTTLRIPAEAGQPGAEIPVGTPAWYTWLAEAASFAFRSAAGSFTARKERHGQTGWRWKAYRRQAGKLYTGYLGQSSDLTLDRLQAIAADLARRGAGSVAATPSPPPAPPAPAAPILTTKLYLPRARPGIVPRPRLTARLTAGLAGKLTLISAPTGSGKTTLLSAWIQALQDARHPVAWLSLDEADSDPVEFLRYLVAAVRTLAPGVGAGVLAQLQAPAPQLAPRPSFPTLLTLLVNDLTSLPEASILILDDYHLLQGQPIHEALYFLLEHLPGQLHVVIATREDPPLPLARMRARGQINEVRGADLRFTADEAAAFLQEMMGLPLSAADVAALEERTEGWIAGLQLAALSMRERTDLGGFIAAFTGSHRFVLDYLADEVFNRQSPAVQTFLLNTCLLDRLCGPLCDAVIGAAGSQAMLQHLERANLFLVPLDAERRWYRYHHLFADLLRMQLHQTPPQPVAELHHRASRWFAEEGLVAEAIHHALAARDFFQVERVIGQHAETLWMRGEQASLRRWLAALPDEVIQASPRLLVILAWTRFLLSVVPLDDLETLLDTATAVLDRTAAPEPEVPGLPPELIRGMIAVVRSAVVSSRGDVARVRALAQEAFQYLPESSTYWRSVAAINLGFAHSTGGDLEAATQMLEEAIELCQAVGNSYAALVGMQNLGRVWINRGQLHQAAACYSRALALLEHQGTWLAPFGANVHGGLAHVFYEWNDLDAALVQLHQTLEQGQLPDQAGALLEGYILLARIKQAQGDPVGARDALERTTPAIEASGVTWPVALLAAHHAQLALRQGRLADASRWLADVRLDAASPAARSPQLMERIRLVMARVRLAQDQPAAALPLLEGLATAAEDGKNVRILLEVRMLQALARQALGDPAQALMLLHQALDLAAPGGYVRRFLDEGEPMAALLRQAARHSHPPAYLDHVLAAFAPESRRPAPPPLPVSPHPDAPLVEPLNERELTVLCLIAGGLSNRQIAAHLVVALSTVKWYVNNIYSKLGVNSRTQALARAREAGLL